MAKKNQIFFLDGPKSNIQYVIGQALSLTKKINNICGRNNFMCIQYEFQQLKGLHEQSPKMHMIKNSLVQSKTYDCEILMSIVCLDLCKLISFSSILIDKTTSCNTYS